MSRRIFTRRKKPLGVRRGLILLVALIVAGYYGLQLHSGDGPAPTQELTGEAAQALETARQHLAQGRLDEARALLDPMVAPSKDTGAILDALRLLADVEQRAGNLPKALELLKRAATDFPHSSQTAESRIAYARALENAGQDAEATRVFTLVQESAPPELRAPAETGLARLAEKQNDLPRAREWLVKAVNDAEWNSPAWEEASLLLGRVNTALMFSPIDTPDSRRYTVRPGDTIISIGVALNTTQGLLTRANNLNDDSQLHPGMSLKYTPKDFRLVVERSNSRLLLLDKDGFFRWYPCVFRGTLTLGGYRIGNKGRSEALASPMPLVPERAEMPTNQEIGREERPGAVTIALSTQDFEELFDLVARSTQVDIVEQFSPAETHRAVKK